jgi:hypothetical protein
MFYATKQYTYDCQMMSAGKLAAPESLYVALVTDSPDYSTSTFDELTEIAAGNGYTSGGKEVEPGDITVSKETAYTELELPIIQWIADGGAIPSSGDGALYAVLLTDEVTVSDRRVWGYGQLSGEITITNGQALELGNPDTIRIRIQEPSS